MIWVVDRIPISGITRAGVWLAEVLLMHTGWDMSSYGDVLSNSMIIIGMRDCVGSVSQAVLARLFLSLSARRTPSRLAFPKTTQPRAPTSTINFNPSLSPLSPLPLPITEFLSHAPSKMTAVMYAPSLTTQASVNSDDFDLASDHLLSVDRLSNPSSLSEPTRKSGPSAPQIYKAAGLRPPSHPPTAKDWELYRDVILQTFKSEAKTVKELKEILDDRHGFKAS